MSLKKASQPEERNTFEKSSVTSEKASEKAAAPSTVIGKSDLNQDFRTATRVLQHIKTLSSEEDMVAFAKKYNIHYKTVAEIRNNARTKFLKGR